MGWQFNPFTGQLDKVGQSSGGSQILQYFSGTIPAGNTLTLFSDAFSTEHGSKIYFSASNTLNTRYKTYDISATKNGSDLLDIVSRVGTFNLDVAINLNAGNIELVVTNNEPYSATIQGYRFNF